MTISYVGAGAGTSGTAAITPALPTGLTTDDGNGIADLLVVVLEHANQATTISNSNGGTWNQVTGSPQGTGTAGGLTSAGCQVYTSRYNGTQGNPTITDAGDHTAGRIYAYRGVDPTTPINASTGSVEATSDTSLSAPGVTTTTTDCWVLHAATLMDDAQDFGATWTNANLTGITVRNASFGHASGNDGRLVLVDGVKATAGATGNTTNTLTAASVKAFVTLALAPAPITPTTSITPAVAVLSAPAVTPTPQPVTTAITAPSLVLTAVELTGSAGPGSLIITPTALRLDPVAVTPTPQPVTTTITPAALRLEPVPGVVPLRESMDKADGPGLGPDRTWTRRVYLQSTQWATLNSQARFGIASPAGSPTDHTDLTVPSPNIDGVNNQTAILPVTAATIPAGTGYSLDLRLLARFALTSGNTNFRGYAAALSWNDVAIPPFAPADAVWLILARYDALDQATVLSVRAMGLESVILPGTLTLRADDDQISATFTHGGDVPLVVAATDTTYTDGGIALAGHIEIDTGDTGHVTVDDLYAYIAPDQPATTQLYLTTPSGLQDGHRLLLTAVPVTFVDGINAGDTASPPTDAYDAADSATPPTDLTDPELGIVEPTPLTLHLEAIPVAPVGSGPNTTDIAPATLHLSTGILEFTGHVTLTPALLRLATTPIGAPVVHVPPPIHITVTPAPGNLVTRVDSDYRISANGQDSQVAVTGPDNRIEVTSG